MTVTKSNPETIFGPNTLNEHLIQESKINFNLSQEIIFTTEDKVRLCLGNHLEKIEKNKSWIAPLEVSLTLLLTLITTEPKDFMNISKESWRAVFIMGLLIGMFLTVKNFILKGRSSTINTVISEIKKGSHMLEDQKTSLVK